MSSQKDKQIDQKSLFEPLAQVSLKIYSLKMPIIPLNEHHKIISNSLNISKETGLLCWNSDKDLNRKHYTNTCTCITWLRRQHTRIIALRWQESPAPGPLKLDKCTFDLSLTLTKGTYNEKLRLRSKVMSSSFYSPRALSTGFWDDDF